MKKHKQDEWVEDVEMLLEQSVLEEATSAVWQVFEKALKNLDEESSNLVRQYLEGTPVKELSQHKQLTEKELEAWLAKAKRELIETVRREVAIKQ